MSDDPGNAGGYRCPIPGCDQRRVIQQLLDQHIRREHPDLEEA